LRISSGVALRGGVSSGRRRGLILFGSEREGAI
jgi:hypothetical protein